MASTRLILVNELQTSPSGDDIVLDNAPTFENISVPITFQIADVREPGQGSGSYSKTIQIPGSPEVNIFFENVYDVNISLQVFNPNLKVKAYYYVDDLLNFEGHLQIIKINVDEVTKRVVYECNIIGEVITLFTKIKDKFVSDLNFSPYDHALTYANITASWSATPGTGYVYPLADWGLNNSNLAQVKPQHFRACLYKREILQKIFAAEGYTWTSTFLDSTDFKRKVQPPTSLPVLSTTVLNNNKFLSLSDGTQQFNLAMTANGGTQSFGSNTWTTLQFPNETYDAGGLFDQITLFNFAPAVSNKYNISAYMAFNFVLMNGASPSVDISNTVTSGFSGIHVAIVNANTQQVLGLADLNLANCSFAANNSNSINVIIPNVDLIAGQSYYVRIKFPNVQVYTTPNAGSGCTLEITNVTGSNFSAEFATNAFYEGANVECNDLLPRDYKQADFISDLKKEFNLYFLQDKANPNNIIIEPRPDFYSTTARDWSGKHDERSVEVIPMGELDFSRLICKHSEDGDYFNKLYIDEFKEPYGTQTYQITNDFIKGDKVIQTNIAPTPYAWNPSTGLVVPTMVKKDNTTTGPIAIKPRTWHWSGSINLPIGVSWQFVYNAGANTVTYTTLPHAGHTDNPYAPTLDLCWDEPDKVYYAYPNQQWTDNNLYNKYYSQYINQITDKNSKIIRTRFYLNSNDIHIFDFRYPIFTFINGEQGYYLVNKIEDYNPLVSESTMVELLKLTDYPVFTPTDSDKGGGLGGGDQGWARTTNDNITKGDNNFNYGDSSMVVGGSENFVSQGAEDIILLNSEQAVILPEYNNFVGIQIDENVTPENNTFNVQNSIITNKEAGQLYATTSVYQKAERVDSALKTSSFTVDGTKGLYKLDLSSNPITITWDTSIGANWRVTFKIVGVGNTLTMDATGSPSVLFEGVATPYVVPYMLRDSITVQYDGTDLHIV